MYLVPSSEVMYLVPSSEMDGSTEYLLVTIVVCQFHHSGYCTKRDRLVCVYFSGKFVQKHLAGLIQCSHPQKCACCDGCVVITCSKYEYEATTDLIRASYKLEIHYWKHVWGKQLNLQLNNSKLFSKNKIFFTIWIHVYIMCELMHLGYLNMLWKGIGWQRLQLYFLFRLLCFLLYSIYPSS